MTVSDDLLKAALNYLNITWGEEDREIEDKVSDILLRGGQYLDDIAGASLVYTGTDTQSGLLFDYARYALADSLEDFQPNYLHELLALRIRTEAAENVAEQAAPQ